MSGEARGYSWPAFEPGNTAAMQSGRTSERRVGPLADQLAVALMDSEYTPDYLRDDPSFRPAIAALCRAEAIVMLLTAYLDTFDIEAALTERTDVEETEQRDGKRVSRVSASRRVTAALAALDRHETRASSLRQQLGLTPLSRARVLRDLSAARYMTGGKSLLERRLDEIESERQAALDAATTTETRPATTVDAADAEAGGHDGEPE